MGAGVVRGAGEISAWASRPQFVYVDGADIVVFNVPFSGELPVVPPYLQSHADRLPPLLVSN